MIEGVMNFEVFDDFFFFVEVVVIFCDIFFV